jgi:hypothetical protein
MRAWSPFLTSFGSKVGAKRFGLTVFFITLTISAKGSVKFLTKVGQCGINDR